MQKKYIIIIVVACLIGAGLLAVGLYFALRPALEISITHINDFHGQFAEQGPKGTICEGTQCLGGFARMYHKIKEIKKTEDSILVNVGDSTHGTAWSSTYKYNVTTTFFNRLPFDAVGLGPRDFDESVTDLVEYMKNLASKVVVCNVYADDEPRFNEIISKSIVVKRSGYRVGIIGVVSSLIGTFHETLNFSDVIVSVNNEAQRLVDEEHVFTSLVLSFCSYDVNRHMALFVGPRVSVIVGGYRVFLYNGITPRTRKVIGPYPTVVVRRNGIKVLIVHTIGNGEDVGHLYVSYDSTGNVKKYHGLPIFLDSHMSEDPDIKSELGDWAKELYKRQGQIVGVSNVHVISKTCNIEECLMGNFVADAVHDSCTSSQFAVIHIKEFRSSFLVGNITIGRVKAVVPRGMRWVCAEIEGRYIKELLEYSFGVLGQLIHVSGLSYTICKECPYKDKITDVKVGTGQMNMDSSYKFGATPLILHHKFKMINDNVKNVKNLDIDCDALVAYIKKKSPIEPKLEERIKYKITIVNEAPPT